MMKFSRRALILLIATAATACATAPKAEGPRTKREALPYRLLIAPPQMELDLEKWNTKPSQRYSVEADPATIQRAIAEGFRKEGLFREVEVLPSLEDGDPMRMAADKGGDLLLEVRVKRRVASYLGGNSLYVPNLLVWFMAWIPSWWVKDESYALDLEIEVDLRSVHSGMSIYSGVHRVKSKEDLDDFQRGWQFLGIFRVPGSLDLENWRSIDQALATRAEGRLAGELAHDVAEKIEAGVGTPEFQRALARRYALVIGVSRFEDYRIQNLRFADADALAFRDHLVTRAGVPAHNTRLLLNGQATLPALREAVEEFAERGEGKDDEILIYFAGYGAWSEGSAYLVPYDADSDRPGDSTLPLEDLLAFPSRTDGPRVTLILDAPFVGSFQGRAVGDESTGALEDSMAGFLDSPSHRVLSACRVGEGCVELEDLRHGLFTYYLLQGLEGRGDRDRDGEVTLDEAFSFAGRMAEAHARLEGKVQRPEVYRGAEPMVMGEGEDQ